jgi:RNA polymerase sigma-70 factor, ECF subfamily
MPPAVFRKISRATAGDVRRLDLDRPLVEAARHDPERFDALYRKYVAQVYGFVYYELGDHHAAEDATELTFLRALIALPRFEERATRERAGTRVALGRTASDSGPDASTFRVWLFRIARNVVSNERRHARRHPVTDLAAVDIAADPAHAARGDDVERAAVLREEVATAWSVVERLPDDRRRAIVLRFVDEMSTSEIAAVLGRSEGAVRVLIHRALRAVARELDRSGDRR